MQYIIRNDSKTYILSIIIYLLLTLLYNASPVFAQTIPEKPNVIVILTDDQGYADAGFQGFPASSEVVTPNIDDLAESGIIFENGYVASSTCGPSRASLLTGRTSSRFGIERNNTWPDKNTGPPIDEIIIPALISEYGYTSAAFGKWHLGELDGMLPLQRGFDYYWGDIPRHKDYLMTHLDQPPVWDPPKTKEEKYLMDAYTDEAIDFISRNKNNPFFAYVAYNAPHSPFRTKKRLVERVVAARPQFEDAYERMKQETEKWDGVNYDFGTYKGLDLDQEILRLVYISMLLSVDDGVGKLVDTLENLNLREKTLIFYLSDNGAALDRPNDLGGVNIPLRDGKGSVYDGGVVVTYVMS